MINLHTHTYRCKHAEGDVVDYARAALAGGGTVLGMTDHTPLPTGDWLHVRMTLEELDGYLEAIDRAREAVPGLRILKGLECEWRDDCEGFYREELLGKRSLGYLMLGQHWFPFQGEWIYAGECRTPERLRAYAAQFIRGMESGLFAFVAHPDTFGATPLAWSPNVEAASRDILEAARALGVPLEINGYGMRKPQIATSEGPRLMYPWERFWELAGEVGVTVVCNSDAHRPCDVLASIPECEAMAGRHGLALADVLGHLR